MTRLQAGLVALALLVAVVWLLVSLWHRGTAEPEPVEVQALETIAKFPLVFPTTSTTGNPARVVMTATARSAPTVSRPTGETNFDSSHKPPAGRYAGTVNGSPCGDTLPPCRTLWIESKGSPTAVNPTGCGGRGCFGAWQFDPRTWNDYAGYDEAHLAPLEVQNDKARHLWAGGAGCSHWAACA